MTESELEAIRIAMNMEIKSHNRYQSFGGKSAYATEKRFYEALAGEKRGHQLALSDA